MLSLKVKYFWEKKCLRQIYVQTKSLNQIRQNNSDSDLQHSATGLFWLFIFLVGVFSCWYFFLSNVKDKFCRVECTVEGGLEPESPLLQTNLIKHVFLQEIKLRLWTYIYTVQYNYLIFFFLSLQGIEKEGYAQPQLLCTTSIRSHWNICKFSEYFVYMFYLLLPNCRPLPNVYITF